MRRGQLFDLGQTIEAGATNDAAANLDRSEMTTHVGTYIDALGHFTCGAEMYGGVVFDLPMGFS